VRCVLAATTIDLSAAVSLSARFSSPFFPLVVFAVALFVVVSISLAKSALLSALLVFSPLGLLVVT
jgi:hypothetical protein